MGKERSKKKQRQHWKWLITGLIVLILLITVAAFFMLSNLATPSEPSAQGVCSSDADCVPASCCHPTSCTTKAKAPECKGAICTAVCAPGSLDCGQGSCSCVNSKCKAVLKS